MELLDELSDDLIVKVVIGERVIHLIGDANQILFIVIAGYLIYRVVRFKLKFSEVKRHE